MSTVILKCCCKYSFNKRLLLGKMPLMADTICLYFNAFAGNNESVSSAYAEGMAIIKVSDFETTLGKSLSNNVYVVLK